MNRIWKSLWGWFLRRLPVSPLYGNNTRFSCHGCGHRLAWDQSHNAAIHSVPGHYYGTNGTLWFFAEARASRQPPWLLLHSSGCPYDFWPAWTVAVSRAGSVSENCGDLRRQLWICGTWHHSNAAFHMEAQSGDACPTARSAHPPLSPCSGISPNPAISLCAKPTRNIIGIAASKTRRSVCILTCPAVSTFPLWHELKCGSLLFNTHPGIPAPITVSRVFLWRKTNTFSHHIIPFYETQALPFGNFHGIL